MKRYDQNFKDEALKLSDDIGIRVVYKLVEDEETHEMYILVISARADNEVYDLAGKRK